MAKRTSRRFDHPRFGVSAFVVQEEAKELKRELDDYLLLSVNDSRHMLDQRRATSRGLVNVLSERLNQMAERERTALQRIVFRDCLLLLSLYVEVLGAHVDLATGKAIAATPSSEGDPQESFSEWLFR
jgi:hypothetical protein